MIDGKWWERYPDRLAFELEQLELAGVKVETDQAALRAGVMRFRLGTQRDSRPLKLVTTFPDLYPYFRFEVSAPDEALPHHQNPEAKNLCLLGRSTVYWNTNDTVAGMLATQVPKVFETALATDRQTAVGKEQPQAEPFSDYYPYLPSMILVDTEWVIPREEESGILEVGIRDGIDWRRAPWIHGAILEVRNNSNRVLARCDRKLANSFSKMRIMCRWVRAKEPIHQFDPTHFFDAVTALDPGKKHNREHVVPVGHLQLWGVLFPEEVGYGRMGEGWVFACRLNRSRSVVSTRASLVPKAKVTKETLTLNYFARAGRAGPKDLSVRLPELQPLSECAVAVFGLGCVGAPSALELARAGVAELRVLDGDIVDPGTVGRWPIGLSAAGRKKVEAFQELIARDYPYTRVVSLDYRIGGVKLTDKPEGPFDEEFSQKMVNGIRLIYDATAEVGVQHFLTDLARARRIPYIAVTGTHGGWGGKVLYLDPVLTEGCWLCYRYACEDGTIKEPPENPNGVVQPVGCGDPTFIGAGFDLATVALAGVRMAVSALCGNVQNSYPSCNWDVLTIAFRDEAGRMIPPLFQPYKLQKHPKCPRCNK